MGVDHILWLGDEACHTDSLVGGKAASLSRLAATHPVPPGFAIAALPASADVASDGLALAVHTAYHELAVRCGDAEPAVAVRSSALDEDGAGASFAGQHDTYLNIRGTSALVDAVQRCVRSACSDEALAYRQRRGLPVDDVRIAVLVQQLVPADVAAVAFSANPITGSREEIMINANWGLGESIVGGMVTPDTFVVRKHTADIILCDVATKTRMTVMLDDGTEESDVPEALRSKPCLTDEQIAEIARLATALEATTGYAVDIECAIARNSLYLLQCRPITALG
jgi:pyruvate,water dikinase